MSDTSINRLIYNVVADNWAFDYANRFRARNESLPAASEWIMPDSIFTAFKAFIDPTRFKYDKACEQGIDYLRKAAEAEGYMNDSVKAQIELLAGMLKHDLDHDLDFNKANLVRILDTEISERYYDEGDRVMRALRYDMELDTARAVVLDRDRYNALLRPSK